MIKPHKNSDNTDNNSEGLTISLAYINYSYDLDENDIKI